MLLLLILILLFPSTVLSQNTTCPLDFSILRTFAPKTIRPSSIDTQTECHYILQSLRLVHSNHLRLSGNFLPPLSAAESCWSDFQSLVSSYAPNFDIRSSCGFQTPWISQGCMNITTRTQFDSVVPKPARDDITAKCNQSLFNGSPCASCTTVLAKLPALYLTGPSIGNVSDCTAYSFIYAAAFANQLGPTDAGTAICLFNLDFAAGGPPPKASRRHKITVVLALVCSGLVALAAIGGGFWAWRRRKERVAMRRRELAAEERERGLGTALDSISGSTNLVKFSFDDIKKATKNFSRHNIVGTGGYGNVYKGVLADGAEVALKRFKNCSAVGDANFAHEVEVIASVRHVNLVSLRGYCIATTQYEGHQRIIVCDLMKNGSLHDHLFGSDGSKLSWPTRQNIALGTARGLAYLHYGAQPAILHRDIKANNILLDETFEAKVADFGLAKFTPEGMTHLSTRVAGTMGYVAPEYALYGQLSERSDVYSFGVVLLELLSGKKALLMSEDSQPMLLTDWAWALVKEGRALDVVEDNMPEKGTVDVLEKYVLVAVLCSHPQLLARPTMDQVVKMLETDLSVPSIPERPLPIVADIDDIERSMSSVSSVSAGYQQY